LKAWIWWGLPRRQTPAIEDRRHLPVRHDWQVKE
jgi:hypothetical protein